VLENKRFNEGNLTTKFIPEEYPNGFHGHRYTEAELDDVLAIAALMIFRREQRAWEIEGQQATAEIPDDLGHMFLSLPSQEGRTVEAEVWSKKKKKVYLWFEKTVGCCQVLEADEEGGVVRLGGAEGRELVLSCAWQLHEAVCEARFADDGRVVAVQPLGRAPNGLRLQHVGSELLVQSWSAAANQLRAHLPPPRVRDLGAALLSPMPGTVVSVDCVAGARVFAGQALLVLEAMKMQNVLRAPRDCIVKSVAVKKGQEVAVDQLLVEFQDEAKK
jgi:propionyl-CoA carboxylase alpha chain